MVVADAEAGSHALGKGTERLAHALARRLERLEAGAVTRGVDGRIASVAAIIAVAVNTDDKREIVGLHTGPSEAETFWATFLRSLVRRGLRGTKLVISDAHEGLKAAIRRVMGSTWQRCRAHWMRNTSRALRVDAQAYVPKGQQIWSLRR